MGEINCLQLLLVLFLLYSVILVNNKYKLFGILVLHAHNQDP